MAGAGAHRDPEPIFMKLPGPSCLKFLLNSEKNLFKFHIYQVDIEELGGKSPKYYRRIFSVLKFIANSAMI